MTKKKPEQIPIEEAIGERAKDLKVEAKKIIQNSTKMAEQILSETQEEPSPSEMQTLEELNHETVERLQDQYPEEEEPQMVIESGKPVEIKITPKIPVSKPESQPATKTCSPESPPQETEKSVTLEELHQENFSRHKKEELKQEFGLPKGAKITPCDCPQNHDENIIHIETPAEDKELTALKKYIMGSGFVPTGVAYHIVALCSQPMTTPCTTTWDFKDRAMVPEMVFTLLRQPGYLEGVWPSLKVVMSSNIGNDSWCAGICTTIAFFDVIRTLPAIKELANETEKKS